MDCVWLCANKTLFTKPNGPVELLSHGLQTPDVPASGTSVIFPCDRRVEVAVGPTALGVLCSQGGEAWFPLAWAEGAAEALTGRRALHRVMKQCEVAEG